MEIPKEKKKILIVEDELSMLKILVDTFKKENFLTLEARDGESAFSRALLEKPDIILLDILLPKIDGLAVLKKLRAENEYGKSVPVIFLTNLSPDREEINKVITENNPAYYLVKTNWNMEDVVEKVRKCLSGV
ncbi:MAG: response regulator [Patescibacteria group bacterium]